MVFSLNIYEKSNNKDFIESAVVVSVLHILVLQRTLVITTLFVTKDIAV